MLILPDTAESHSRAARVIAEGGVIAFRTDTFYGLGADPFNRAALVALNELKGREGKPLLVVIGDPADAGRLVRSRTRLFDALAAAHWPGALTIVAEAHDDVPGELIAGTGKVGVRLPGDEAVRALVRACGGALTATSANPAGAEPASTAADVERYFGPRLRLVIDGGAARADRPSTVVEATGQNARLIREGVVRREELVRTLRRIGAALA